MNSKEIKPTCFTAVLVYFLLTKYSRQCNLLEMKVFLTQLYADQNVQKPGTDICVAPNSDFVLPQSMANSVTQKDTATELTPRALFV